jgi:8-oxo-dGTP diphosphatase
VIREVQQRYGDRVRVRACGLLVMDNALLLVNHRSLTATDFWAPPGGGVEFGERAEICLVREFLEETGLQIQVGDFLFACEFIHPPLHSVELFFLIDGAKGIPTKGNDPEMTSEGQIIEAVRFIPWTEIQQMNPAVLHGLFRLVGEPAQILQLKGYLTLPPIPG